MPYVYLAIAIISEVVATTALKASDGFSKLFPVIIVVLGYGLSFYFLSLVLKTIPLGIAYAIWAGVGIILVALIGIVLYKQIPDLAAIIGVALIIAGVAIINIFSKTVSH